MVPGGNHCIGVYWVGLYIMHLAMHISAILYQAKCSLYRLSPGWEGSSSSINLPTLLRPF